MRQRYLQALSPRVGAVLLGIALASSSAFASDITGRVSGTIVDSNGKPIAGASVSVQSPSQSASTVTDARGHYAFVSLTPDSYTLTVHDDGYRDEKLADLFVQADMVKDESLALEKAYVEIGHVTAHSRSSLVQPGITSDEYSINQTQQNASHALGGGNDQSSITSSLATVPGVFVPVGQQPGWGQSVFIRGGDWAQTGFEYDGVPLNRVFDQYSQSSLSSLGASEIQVYTGGAPIDQQTEGIGGYINQVVKSGSYPNTVTADVGVGGPAFYNKANLEFSGADGPDQKFTYYLGVGGYGFSQRLIDQYNGASVLSQYAPIAGYTPGTCGPNNNSGSCYANGGSTGYIGGLPIQPNGYQTLPSMWGEIPSGSDEEVVGNLHFAIPHHRDTQRDDLQLLYTNSQFDATPNASVSALGPYAQVYQPYYIDQNAFTGPLYGPLTDGQLGDISNVLYHGNQSTSYYSPLSATQSDSQLNEFSLGKLSYRHNISTDSNVRLTLYEDQSTEWDSGIVGVFLPYANGPEISDYLVSSQTTGLDAAYTKQLNAQNLVNADLSENTTKSVRYNNLTAAFGGSSSIAMLVNGNNPTGGCYGVDANGQNPQLTDCASPDAASYQLPGVSTVGPGYQLVSSAANVPTIDGASALTCGTGPCTYYTVSNGSNTMVDAVTSRFSSLSLSDHLTPSRKLAMDLGLRYDLFQYFPANTDTPANQLFVNTYNQLNCISGTTIVSNPIPGGSCSAVGPGYTATNLTDQSHPLSYHELSPRFGAAYSLDPKNVLRFSYGRFAEPAPSSAEEGANTGPFYANPVEYAIYGWNGPTYDVQPEVSYNTDLSWEHQFNDNLTSMKVTPFYRATNNEFSRLVIDPKTDLLAYINGLNRQSSGIEFALRRGDFKKNGWSSMLAYTFTHSVAQFTQSPTGGSFVTVANQAIQNFNGFTSYCASNGGSAVCPQTPVVAAAPCYFAASGGGLGTPAPACGAGTIANPYWNVKPALLLDPNASYAAYEQALGAGAGGGSTSSTQPNVASLVVNYRHDRLAITPSFQYEAGARYGSPLAAQGVNPASCSAGLNTALANDPRYSSGVAAVASSAQPYDASSCTSVMAIPDPYTGSFDSVGQFVQPSLLTMNLQMSYEASKNATIELMAANVLYRCFGGSKVPWGAGNLGCNYAQTTPYVGNVYNPGDSIQQIAEFPYSPIISSAVQYNTASAPLPLELYLDVKFRM